MALGFALTLQRLPGVGDRVLVVSQLAGLRNGTGWFKAPEVGQLFEDFRVPHERRNTTRDLGNLRRRGWLIKRERERRGD